MIIEVKLKLITTKSTLLALFNLHTNSKLDLGKDIQFIHSGRSRNLLSLKYNLFIYLYRVFEFK